MDHKEKMAFPTVMDLGFGSTFYQQGMTLRQWYAGMAMQGILSNSSSIIMIDSNIEKYIKMSIKYANAMIRHEMEDKKCIYQE